MGKREEKKEALRKSLIKAAKGRLITNGLEGLRARDITKDAGCGLGTLYSAFEDIDHLVLQINTDTLKIVGEYVDKYVSRQKTDEGKIIAMAKGYLAFTCENRNLWEALFNYKYSDGTKLPDWHLIELNALFDKIAEPFSRLCPNLGKQELALRSKTIFSAVHGIISISIQERFIAVPRKELEAQLTQFVKSIVRGCQDE